MVYDFEGRMEQYRQQIEEMESHLVSLNQPSMITPQGILYYVVARETGVAGRHELLFSSLILVYWVPLTAGLAARFSHLYRVKYSQQAIDFIDSDAKKFGYTKKEFFSIALSLFTLL